MTDTPSLDQRWVVKIPTAIFQQLKNDPEFCALLTLARAINALHFVLTPMLEMGLGDSPRVARARSNSLVFTCALFAEVVPLVEGMQRYFKTHEAFQKVAKIIHSEEAKQTRKGNVAVRNKLVFHFDMSEVQEQIKTFEREDPTVVSGIGPNRLNVHYDLADLITLRTLLGASLLDDLQISQQQIHTVTKVVVEFLVAADEFIVTVMTERKWAEMRFL